MGIQKELQRNKKLGLGAIMVLVLVLLVTTCGVPKTESGGAQGTSTTGSSAADGKTDSSNLKGKRVALIMEFNTGTFSQQYVQGVEEEVKKFGGTLTKFVADNDGTPSDCLRCIFES